MPRAPLLALLALAATPLSALPWDGTYRLSEGADCARVGQDGGALRISETSREVWLQGAPVPLTTQEFELLSLLAHRAGELVSRDEVFRTMRGIDYDGLDRSIDGRVSKLRRKLGDDAAAPTRIKTVWGKGYLLVPDAWGDLRQQA